MRKSTTPLDDHDWLVAKSRPQTKKNGILRTVDLFAGCGGISLGVELAAQRMGKEVLIEFANEWDSKVFEIYLQNFDPRHHSVQDITTHLDILSESIEMSDSEKQLLKANPGIMDVDLLTGGPPCQGHSDLNNHTRRGDERNNLYFAMLRFATVFKPKSILIENVRTVIHSGEQVSQRTIEGLEKLGYHCKTVVLKAVQFGIPQTRERHFVLAALAQSPNMDLIENAKSSYANERRDLSWAIADLVDSYQKGSMFDGSSTPSERNQQRMDYLIEHGLHDLPNEERPPCHQNGHNYPAVYGRLHWDSPAPTITVGFASNGQGRFQHPDASPGRTITPHEAARIQTFPDWFDFTCKMRGTLKKGIGNAVPPLLAVHPATALIQTLEI